jgi:hypothetical protein
MQQSFWELAQVADYGMERAICVAFGILHLHLLFFSAFDDQERLISRHKENELVMLMQLANQTGEVEAW